MSLHASTANEGMAVAATDVAVKVEQNAWAVSRRCVARRARRQLSALQPAAAVLAARRAWTERIAAFILTLV